MKRLCLTALLLTAWQLPAHAQVRSCSDSQLCCWQELLKITTGTAMSQSVIDAHKGPDVIDFWSSSGFDSQNIPVICRTADYWKNGNSTWFHQYFNDQLPGGAAGGFQGEEVLSPLYGPHVVSAVMAVHEKATVLNDTALRTKARDWLRTYWAVNALAAHIGPWTSERALVSGSAAGDVTDFNPGVETAYAGLSIAAPGTRRLTTTYDPDGTDQPNVAIGQFLLTLALDHSPRRLDYNNLNERYYDPFRLALFLLGTSVTTSVNLGAVSTPVDKFGLTAAERNTLASFVSAPGQSAATLNQVLGLIGHGSRCAMTFQRSSEGSAAWFGNDAAAVGSCHPHAGGLNWYGVTMSTARAGQLLIPYEQTSSKRVGSRIETQPANLGLTIPGGTVLYKVVWGQQGPSLVQAPPAEPRQGFVELTNCYRISGWAWNPLAPSTFVTLELWDGGLLLATAPANILRDNLPSPPEFGNYGFNFNLPNGIRNSQPHNLSIRFAGTTTQITGSPVTLTCHPLTVTRAGTGSGSVQSDPFGISCGSECSYYYPASSVVSLTPQASLGSFFAGWSGNADCIDSSVTMTASRACTATFSPTGCTPNATTLCLRGGRFKVQLNAGGTAGQVKTYTDQTGFF
jgi:hypothetical protein